MFCPGTADYKMKGKNNGLICKFGMFADIAGGSIADEPHYEPLNTQGAPCVRNRNFSRGQWSLSD